MSNGPRPIAAPLGDGKLRVLIIDPDTGVAKWESVSHAQAVAYANGRADWRAAIDGASDWSRWK